MIEHDGKLQPILTSNFDPNDKDWIYFAWDNLMQGSSIVSSTFQLPTTWSAIQTQTNISVTDENGDIFTNVNGVLVSNDDLSGMHKITNTVIFSDGRELERTVKVRVKDL